MIEAGGDQFGGNNEKGPVLEAYEMGVKEHGEEYMRNRFEQSAVRLLKNIIRPGLFENPYLVVAESEEIVGKPEYMKAGYEAQLKSVVMLKNKDGVFACREKVESLYSAKIYSGWSQLVWNGYRTKLERRCQYGYGLPIISK